MMCARLLKPERTVRRGAAYRMSERVFNGMHGVYDRTLRWSLGHPSLMLMPTVVAVVLSAYLFSLIPKGFFPEQDTGRLLGIIQAGQGQAPL
jgi:multidrug efflux pump